MRVVFLFAFFAVFFSVICVTECTTFGISGRKLLVNGQPFLMKGVGYYPIPIGYDPSAKYDQFSNSTSDRAVWTRDIANFQSMGLNTIRTYGFNNDGDHTAWFNALQAAGVYVIVEYWFDGGKNLQDAATVSSLVAGFRNMVTKQQHPAVLMWLINNEVNAPWLYQNTLGPFFDFADQCAGVLRSIEGAGHRPLGTTFADFNIISAIQQYDGRSSVDVWNVQLYRGKTFGDFFTKYSPVSSKPLFITEFGIDAYNSIAKAEDGYNQSLYETSLWNEIAANINIVSGGCIFEYCDEWWKDSEGGCDTSPSVHGTCGGANNNFPDKVGNAEWFGMYSVAKNPSAGGPDILTPRPVVSAMANLWKSSSTSSSGNPVDTSTSTSTGATSTGTTSAGTTSAGTTSVGTTSTGTISTATTTTVVTVGSTSLSTVSSATVTSGGLDDGCLLPFTSGSNSDQIGYDDALIWNSNSSPDNKPDFSSSKTKHSGSYSIAWVPTNSALLRFDFDPIATKDWNTITFWLSADSSAEAVSLYIYSNTAALPCSHNLSVFYGVSMEWGWKQVIVPLSSFGASQTTKITGFSFQASNQVTQEAIYFDDLHLHSIKARGAKGSKVRLTTSPSTLGARQTSSLTSQEVVEAVSSLTGQDPSRFTVQISGQVVNIAIAQEKNNPVPAEVLAENILMNLQLSGHNVTAGAIVVPSKSNSGTMAFIGIAVGILLAIIVLGVLVALLVVFLVKRKKDHGYEQQIGLVSLRSGGDLDETLVESMYSPNTPSTPRSPLYGGPSQW